MQRDLVHEQQRDQHQQREQHKEVTHLPGWDGRLPSRMFSGFGHAGAPPGDPEGAMWMHYVFWESEGDPAADPILVWYNGGPGASSLFGLLVELGPLLLNMDSLRGGGSVDGAAVPRLIRNPYSWTKVANLLVINSPPPVGFSYCTPAGPTGNGSSCGSWNDTLVARANRQFLVGLMRGPLKEHASKPLFLSGESYAGIYVPTIAREILRDPQGIRLAGMAIGDGCLGTEVLCGCATAPWHAISFFHGHGQVSERLYSLIMASCPERDLRSGELDANCAELLRRMGREIGGYFAYDLYDECYWGWGGDTAEDEQDVKGLTLNSILGPRTRWGPTGVLPSPFSPASPLFLDLGGGGGSGGDGGVGGSDGSGSSGGSDGGDSSGGDSSGGGDGTSIGSGGGSSGAQGQRLRVVDDHPCPGPAMDAWLRLPEVRQALHVDVDSFFFSGDNGAGFQYNLTEKDVRPFHLHVLTNVPGFRTLVYNGDTDPGINSFITQDKWTTFFEERGHQLTSEWRPWTTDGGRRLVGYTMQYEGGWTYATIRGAGHMVPEYKPAASLALITAFLRGEQLKPYNASARSVRGSGSFGSGGGGAGASAPSAAFASDALGAAEPYDPSAGA